MEELRISKSFYFTGTRYESGDIYLDVNCDGWDQEYYTEITKEKAKEIEVLKSLENLMTINEDKRKGNFNFQNLSEAISIALFLKRNRKKQN